MRVVRAAWQACGAYGARRVPASGAHTVVEVRNHADVPIVVWHIFLDSPALLVLHPRPMPLDLLLAARRRSDISILRIDNSCRIARPACPPLLTDTPTTRRRLHTGFDCIGLTGVIVGRLVRSSISTGVPVSILERATSIPDALVSARFENLLLPVWIAMDRSSAASLRTISLISLLYES